MTEESSPASFDITILLNGWMEGDAGAAEIAFRSLYRSLRAIAALRLRAEPHNVSLQPTELVHEAFIRIGSSKRLRFRNREHFFAIAANTLRRVLVDLARQRRSAKRDKGARVTLSGVEMLLPSSKKLDYIELDEALSRLESLEPRVARVIEMRFFAQLTEDEVAETLGVTRKTVGRDWKWGRAWLKSQLQAGMENPETTEAGDETHR